jgi:hypothetical protein
VSVNKFFQNGEGCDITDSIPHYGTFTGPGDVLKATLVADSIEETMFCSCIQAAQLKICYFPFVAGVSRNFGSLSLFLAHHSLRNLSLAAVFGRLSS